MPENGSIFTMTIQQISDFQAGSQCYRDGRVTLSGLWAQQSLHLRRKFHFGLLKPETRDPDEQCHVVNGLEADLQSRPVLEISHEQQQGVDPQFAEHVEGESIEHGLSMDPKTKTEEERDQYQ